MTDQPAPCAAAAGPCGSPGGWRAGGRCLRCRHARNEAEQRRRNPPLSTEERRRVLEALREQCSPDDAAGRIGRPGRSLYYFAQRDAELASALAGEPLNMQRRARLGDYMAAVLRHGGDTQAAQAALGIEATEAQMWADLPGMIPAEALRQVSVRTDQMLKLPELWAGPRSRPELAQQLGMPPDTLTRWARAMGLPPRINLGPRYWHDGDLAPEIKDEFLRLWHSGESWDAIGKRFGVTGQAVAIWARKLNLPARPPKAPSRKARRKGARSVLKRHPGSRSGVLDPKIKEEFTRAWLSGVPVHAIVKQFGIASGTVSKWVDELGLPRRRKRRAATLTPEKAPEFRRMWERGDSAAQIAKHFDTHVQTVTAWRRRLKLPPRWAGGLGPQQER